MPLYIGWTAIKKLRHRHKLAFFMNFYELFLTFLDHADIFYPGDRVLSVLVFFC